MWVQVFAVGGEATDGPLLATRLSFMLFCIPFPSHPFLSCTLFEFSLAHIFRLFKISEKRVIVGNHSCFFASSLSFPYVPFLQCTLFQLFQFSLIFMLFRIRPLFPSCLIFNTMFPIFTISLANTFCLFRISEQNTRSYFLFIWVQKS